jgi:hypothetical protein
MRSPNGNGARYSANANSGQALPVEGPDRRTRASGLPVVLSLRGLVTCAWSSATSIDRSGAHLLGSFVG